MLDRFALAILPLISRFTFAAVLAHYFWASALTKLDGPFAPSLNAYAQIFPRQTEAAGYDIAAFGPFHWAVTMAGTWAEFLLPALIIVGLFTRLASLGMIAFILVQSLTDIIGHGADASTIGAWFDRASDALILDQRLFWITCLLVPMGLGGGALSFDRVLFRQPRTAV